MGLIKFIATTLIANFSIPEHFVQETHVSTSTIPPIRMETISLEFPMYWGDARDGCVCLLAVEVDRRSSPGPGRESSSSPLAREAVIGFRAEGLWVYIQTVLRDRRMGRKVHWSVLDFRFQVLE